MGEFNKHPSFLKNDSMQDFLKYKHFLFLKNSHSELKKYSCIQELHSLEIPLIQGQIKKVGWEDKAFHFSYPILQFRRKSFYKIEEPKNYESILFFFDHCFITDFFERNFKNTFLSQKEIEDPVFLFNADEDFYKMTRKILKSYENKEQFAPCMSGAYLDQVFFMILNSESSQSFINYLCSLKKAKKFDIKFFMEQHYLKPYSNQELADLSFKSLSSFLKEFKAVFNTTPQKWMLKKRLEKAKKLLADSDKSITDICFDLHFKDLSHFSRVFKNEYGESPNQFKKKFSAK